MLAVMTGMTARSLFAQELGYSGVSPVNNSFGGVAVAAPIDGTAAMYWNPATISSLNKGEFQFGFGRTNPPWYGDESLGNTILVPVLGVLWLVSESQKADDYWEKYSNGDHRSSGDNDGAGHSPDDEPQVPGIPKVRSFNISIVGTPSRYSHWNCGFSMTETGQRKQRFVLDALTGEIEGVQIYRVKNIELTPAVSWWNKRKLSFGIAPIFSIDEHPNASLPASRDYVFLGDDRGHVGLGLQLGVYYQAENDFNFGFSVKSPIWIPGQTYRWERLSTGELRVRDSHFSQDSPLRFAFGISYSGINNGLFAVDVRHYDFQHVGSLYDFSSNGGKRTVTSLGAGAEYRISEGIALRMGYQYADGNCNAFEDLVFNTTLPIQRGHSVHFGITLGDPDSWDITFSGSHAFGGQQILLADGRFLDANPNSSTFWWGLRIHF